MPPLTSTTGNACDLPAPPALRVPVPPPPPSSIQTPNDYPPSRPAPPTGTLPPLPGQPGYVPPTVPPPPPYTPPGPGLREFFTGPQNINGAPVANSQQVQTPATDPGSNASWREYGCCVSYLYDSGLLQCPLAQAPTTGTPKPLSVIVQVHAPTGQKIVRYRAERAGVQPLVPPPITTDPNLVLLTAAVEPEQPFLDPGATTWIYVVNATYVYAMLQPQTVDQGYPVGVPAYSTLRSLDTPVPPGNFVQGIV